MRTQKIDVKRQVLLMVKEKKMGKDLAFEILKNITELEEKSEQDIAIIGVSLKFPGADSLEEYWDILINGEVKIGKFPDSRRIDTDSNLSKKQRMQEEPYFNAGFLQDIDKFDAEFFQISPKEATEMDPYQRLFLETAYKAFEDAGYGGKSISGSKVGVFVGADHTYRAKSAYMNMIENPDFTAVTGSWTGILASRVSYIMNLNGPSIVIDSGCSSSAVALHTACTSLKNKECNMALAGGINLLLSPINGSSMLGDVESDNVFVRPFDNRAQGTVWGEGSGAAVLKPLKDAIQDGNHIYAVIKGSAVNNNGLSNAITSLNAKAQKDLIISAWDNAGIKPVDISYIEAHGTGTVVGDAIEVNGLDSAFREFTKEKHICGIGSLKGNMGHLVACSGMASLFKVILSLDKEMIPPNTNFEEPNQSVNFENSSVYVVDKLTPWVKKDKQHRRAGISCFSFSGTNCHLIIEEAPELKTVLEQEEKLCIFTISAKSREALKKLLINYESFFKGKTTAQFNDICFTSLLGRGHYRYRIAVIAPNIEILKEKIAGMAESDLMDYNIPDTFYGEYCVVTSTKKKCGKYEITEENRRKLTQEANLRLRLARIQGELEKKEFLEELCTRYVKGADIDWKEFYDSQKRNRVRLPVYPLARTRYWVKRQGMEESVAPEIIANMKEYEQGIIKKLKENQELISDEQRKDEIQPENFFTIIDRYGQYLLLKTVQKMGIFLKPGVCYKDNDLIASLGIIDLYRKLFSALLNVLEKGGFAKIDGDNIIVCEKVCAPEIVKKLQNIEAFKKDAVSKYREMESFFKLLDTCVENYDKILTGKETAVSIMFADYKMDLPGNIYQGNQGVDYFNQIVGRITRFYILANLNKIAGKCKIKILEVGAGTGGTSASVFPEIAEFKENIEYCYTDISLGFINYGKKTFGEQYPFLTYKLLNIEKRTELQGFGRNEYDIVIAANVIHGTKNLKYTINQVKKLLKKNGIFILNEITDDQDFATLSFGLMPGWWSYEDDDLRLKHSPMLNENGWKRLLRSMGFGALASFNGVSLKKDARDKSVLSIIMGESDGIYEKDGDDEIEIILPERLEYDASLPFEVKLEGREDGNYTEAETSLAHIWAEALGFNTINIYSNFLELGGDSIIAMKVVSIITATMGKKINMIEVLNRPTVSEFAAYLESVLLEKTEESPEYEKIEKVKEMDYYPVSAAQNRMYIIGHFEETSINYNVPTVISIEGNLSRDYLEEVFLKLCKRHEAFRTSFHVKDGEVLQKIEKEGKIEIECIQTDEANLQQLITQSIQPFDLEKAPLARVKMFEVGFQKHIIFIDLHHIICDGTSISVLLKDLIMIIGKEENKLTPIPVQYKDFAVWQNNLLKTDSYKNQEKYWLDQFEGEIPVLNLPLDYKRPDIQSLKGSSIKFCLSAESTAMLKAMVKQADTTMYMILLSAYNILLSKNSGQEDIIVGSVIVGRNHPDLSEVMGMFVNTLAIRNHPSSEKTFLKFLDEVKQTALNAYKNQDYQFEELIERLKLVRSANRNPLFDVVFSLQKLSVPDVERSGFQYSQYNYQSSTSKYDLTLFAEELDNRIIFTLEYCTSLFKEESMIRLSKQYEYILEQIMSDPQICLKDISLIREEEKRKIIEQFSKDSEIMIPENETVVSLFEKQAVRVPDKDVLIWGTEHMTYRELNEEADRIAGFLQTIGAAKPNHFIGIMLHNAPDQVIAILGTLKSGAAYIPIDPDIPYERIKTIVDEAEIETIFSSGENIYELNRLEWECSSLKHFICLDTDDVYGLSEKKKNKLMEDELWEFVGEKSVDEITGGGWNNSYTAEPFSKDEMEEYGENARKKLMPYLTKESKVLEIGCASGITMFRVAPYVDKYVGTDLSNAIQKKNKDRVEKEKIHNIELRVLAAHEIDKIQNETFDIVIINSVIQCFHGHNYLRMVLRKALDLLGEKGIIFLGDLMDQDKKKELMASTAQFVKESKNGYRTKIDWSEELFVAKDFLRDFVMDTDELTKVLFSDKIYTIENELTKYRYDAILYADKKNHTRTKGHKSRYQYDKSDLCGVISERKDRLEKTENLAYSIFTSGTLGKPKGVLVGQEALLNLCIWHNNYYEVTDNDKATRYAAPGFDASVWELFPYLIVGASIHIIEDKIRLDVEKLNAYFEKNSISISFLPTQLCEMFMEYENHSLRVLLTGGDKLQKFKNRHYTLYNNYGPTEYTVVTSSYPVRSHSENIPIGRPIANTHVYILDKNHNLQPIGIPGELCISGKGISKGYLNNQELTDEKFIDNPFGEGKIYCTGDFVRMQADGNLEYIGRIDEQVKIRGYRIELGEIENILLNMEGIKEAAVVVKEHLSDEKLIIAYFTADISIDPMDIRKAISKLLPEYMIPAHIIGIDSIPLTRNGKVDKKKLPVVSIPETKLLQEPENETQEIVCQMFCDILEIPKAGVQDDFFQLGGHSLKAMQLMTMIRDKFQVEIPLGYIFKNPTVDRLTEYIENNAKTVSARETLVCISKGTDNQKNIFLVHSGEGGIEAYITLCGMLKSEWNYWGIQCDCSIGTIPENLTIEELAYKYLKTVKSIQQGGTYKIAGWSTGGVIAYEMVRQLEAKGDQIEFFTVFDSLAPDENNWNKNTNFSLEGEKKLFQGILEVKVLDSCVSMNQLWEKSQEALKKIDSESIRSYLPEVVLKAIPNVKEIDSGDLFRYINRIRIFENAQLRYHPTGKIKTSMHYFKADDLLVQNNIFWEKYCEQVKYYHSSGNHYKMLTKDYVRDIADIVNELLEDIR